MYIACCTCIVVLVEPATFPTFSIHKRSKRQIFGRIFLFRYVSVEKRSTVLRNTVTKEKWSTDWKVCGTKGQMRSKKKQTVIGFWRNKKVSSPVIYHSAKEFLHVIRARLAYNIRKAKKKKNSNSLHTNDKQANKQTNKGNENMRNSLFGVLFSFMQWNGI